MLWYADSLDLWPQNLTELEPGKLFIEVSWVGSRCPVDLTLLEETFLALLQGYGIILHHKRLDINDLCTRDCILQVMNNVQCSIHREGMTYQCL